MRNLIVALVSAGTLATTAGLAQAQTFPNMTGNPDNVLGIPGSSGPVNLAHDFLTLSHASGGSFTADGFLPMSAFAGSADVAATNANLVTTNANLATTNANLATTNANLTSTNRNLAATNTNLAGLQNYATSLRNLALSIRKEARQAAASAMAISAAPMPSAPGRTSWTVNAAEFNSEAGWGGSVAHRLNLSVPFAVTAGFAFSGSNTGARVGFSGEF